ncbi:hypothetical protein Desdi_1512 [Desulfitobacterium dichloroeliminans LMG P-21439]|uniref:Uncharacterized protein n=1 Tax=Desulfitobacterium dichloroeliminans (strain LMG P-21439 / DCA1) TaxID=871963 RepID=L0F7M8_DESDL|nr:hypothetical protein [Desulfitobacterium dichloroeliminans]AGA69005.1 hypothetical protein Desdi_1512 [Desulfitobacterium dichloroeliminans LMG P-21439]
MESLAVAYVLKCKQEKMSELSSGNAYEEENLRKEISNLQELYKEVCENY